LLAECDELIAIFATSINTAQNNRAAKTPRVAATDPK